MTKCERVQTWFEQSLADKLSVSKRLKINTHIITCSVCKVYVLDSKKLQQKLNELHINKEDLTIEERQKIMQNL